MDLLLELDAIDRLVRGEVDGDRPSVLHVRHRFRQRRLPIERHAPIDAALRPEHDGAVAFSDDVLADLFAICRCVFQLFEIVCIVDFKNENPALTVRFAID